MDPKNLLKYENKWIAFSPDRKRIVTVAESIKDLDNKVKKLKEDDYIYHRVFPIHSNYSP